MKPSDGDKVQVKRTDVGELTESEKQEIREAFDMFAQDGSSYLDLSQFKVAMRALGFVPAKGEAKALMARVCDGNNQSMDFSQFQTLMAEKMFERNPKIEIDQAWELFDKDQDGYISFEDLKSITDELGENLTEQELLDMIKEADREKKGMIGKEDFYRVLYRSGLFGVFDDEDDDSD
ncbi:EF hand family protein [Trichomonas vaginalis G3]|uniref:EF hand family protein n=1 Tax=Trichomonas vaginalis (strain ATCC PRA-98 / G3) TaxID=412133 RepID=A2E2Z2_TRIV3|nr:calcium ion binding [Trichomonas vaginalis G3]EAY12928.1 EF hand family protein [Trichomonas vaginalis G3]KAI5499732.1 calcium ion binding [Trichomonas vaginalis G3]|eukprot:XP_001325151.1 EF hand family protein [Trichomonas vaginalis G3]